MARKLVSIFVLAAFSYFNMSCFSSLGSLLPGQPSATVKKTVKKDPSEVDRTNSKIKIVNVVTKSGQSIAFREKDPGHFASGGEAVIGVTLQDLEFDRKDVKVSFTQKGSVTKISKVETPDGRVYKVKSGTEAGGKVRFQAYAPMTIPVSDIQQVWIKKTDAGLTVLAAVVGVGLGIALFYLFIHAFANEIEQETEESCPFVYSYNGEEYVLDAEPYGMAVSEGLKRTDWVEMTNLREVRGKYRVLLTNELNETQYTDELKLAVVDHAAGVKIAPDIAGRMHAFTRSIAPAAAVDGKGRDILKFVAENDRVFWMSRLEEKSPRDADMRDELVFEFPKPVGTESAKLLANVWTTKWGSLSAGRFLRLFGSSLPERYADVDRFGPTYGQFLTWLSSEELYTLKIWVETSSGWKARGMIYGGAPVVTKDKAYVIDIGDVPGDVLRIKLRPPVNFWMVNSLAVDYGGDPAVPVTELSAEKAVGPQGRDVRRDLAATDGVYQTAENRGERTELVFAAPPAKEGLERTVFVKASGYYRIHIDARGEPQTGMIARVLGEPDFAARYSFQEYRKWEAALRAEAAKALQR